MSSDIDYTQIIIAIDELLIANYVTVASCVFVAYESLITSSAEILLFWQGKITGATILFLLNRYNVLIYNVYTLILTIASSVADKDCSAFVYSLEAFSIFQYAPWAVFSGFRMHALSGNYFLSLLVLALSLAPVVLNLTRFKYHVRGVVVPFQGCTPADDIGLELFKTFTIVSRTSLILADAILVCTTWFKLYRGGGLRKKTFAYVLLYDGTVYFVCMLALNSLHLTLVMLSIHTSFQGGSYLIAFIEPLTASLVSRFLIHLQQANLKAIDHHSYSHVSEMSQGSVIFNRVLGSLASTIDPDDYAAVVSGDDIVESSGYGNRDEQSTVEDDSERRGV